MNKALHLNDLRVKISTAFLSLIVRHESFDDIAATAARVPLVQHLRSGLMPPHVDDIDTDLLDFVEMTHTVLLVNMISCIFKRGLNIICLSLRLKA